jgi:hypothetical protein
MVSFLIRVPVHRWSDQLEVYTYIYVGVLGGKMIMRIRSKSLWRWYISTNIMFLDIIQRLVFI